MCLRSEVVLAAELVQCRHFLIESVESGIYACDDTGYISYEVLIVSHTYVHPNDGEHYFWACSQAEISVAHSGDGLEGPVKGAEVLHAPASVHNPPRSHPCVIHIIIQSSHHEPKT